jgi:hypothetical protein
MKMALGFGSTRFMVVSDQGNKYLCRMELQERIEPVHVGKGADVIAYKRYTGYHQPP